MLNTLIRFGGAIKDLGDGKVGGCLVQFGNPSTTDLEGDYFTKDTDFGITWADDGTGGQSAVLYNHGIDPVMKKAKLSDEPATLKRDDVGIWVAGQLAQRNAYEKAVYGMVKSGKLGWSSGTASHLVERKRVGNANEITAWPLGLDASLTPTPAEPRNEALPLKSWIAEQSSMKSLMDNYPGLRQSLTVGAISRLQDYVWNEVYDAVWDGAGPEELAELAQSFDEFSAFAMEVIRALMGVDDATKAAACKQIKSSLLRRQAAADIKTERDFESFLRDAGFSRSQAVAITASGYKTAPGQRDSGGDDDALAAAIQRAANILR